MDKRIIRTWLLNKKPRVYTVIVLTYYEQLSVLKTAMFLDWLARELEIDPAQINLSSINSALRRYRKQQEKKQQRKSIVPHKEFKTRDPFDTELPDGISFR